ncbi:MAG TPA: response regulator [Candidatus Acidoferrales bacterium]|jgi:CheY-like chemotaxis protein|nr:response regulator [Candidatus Angelobacter sp.]HWG86210.1 response regulator [Candidatus Acidoferrales bacterium]
MNRILVAEDNPVNLELLREMLEGLRCEVVEATNGEQALAKVEETRPDLILLDINMPKMNGYDVLARLRQNLKFSGVPVLAVTAYAMKEDQQRVLEAGFNGYLPKPIDTARLLGELRRFGILLD